MKKLINILLTCVVIFSLVTCVSADDIINEEDGEAPVYGGLYPEEVPSAQEQFESFLESGDHSQDIAEVWDKIRGIHPQTPSTQYGACYTYRLTPL